MLREIKRYMTPPWQREAEIAVFPPKHVRVVCGMGRFAFCRTFIRLDGNNLHFYPGVGLCLHLRYGYLSSMAINNTDFILILRVFPKCRQPDETLLSRG